MKTIWLFAVAAILATGAFLGTSAEAGGKKLHFGGPLGSFEATPQAKGSNHSYKSHSKKSSSKAAARRRAAAKRAAARKAAARKAAARKHAAKKAAAKKHAAKKRATSKRSTAKTKSDDTKTVAKSSTEKDENKSAPVKASAIAGTNTLKFRPEPPPESENADTTETADAATDPYECKKYIPSAGMTVSVPCGPDP